MKKLSQILFAVLAFSSVASAETIVGPWVPVPNPLHPVPVPAPAEPAPARREFYLCKSFDRVLMVRVVPSEYRAEVVRVGLPSYRLDCVDSPDGRTWLNCEGADARTFYFYHGGREGLYVGSRQNTPVSCFLANGAMGGASDFDNMSEQFDALEAQQF